ncbi:MAG: hypothetical protein KF690_06450 [Bacteroidetes bacterium]|nr:hypothetical protein [Bacteroidota bacterium]
MLSLLGAGRQPQQPTWPVPLDGQGQVVYSQEVTVPGYGPKRILNAVKGWLLANASPVEGTLNDDMAHDVFSGKFYLVAQGVSTLTGKLSKGDFTYVLEVQAFEGRYLLRLHTIRTTDPLKTQTLNEKYMLTYEQWKEANTFGLLSEEKLRPRYKKYQDESLDALTHIDVALRKIMRSITEYVASNG